MLLPTGYGTAAAIALSILVNAVAALRPAWRYGVVAALALALGSESNMLQTAMDRSLSIADLRVSGAPGVPGRDRAFTGGAAQLNAGA